MPLPFCSNPLDRPRYGAARWQPPGRATSGLFPLPRRLTDNTLFRPEPAMSHQALTDSDYQRLDSILSRFQDQDCMNLEQLDGFFAALLCGPMPIKPAECLPMILGQAFDDETAFPSNKSLEQFAELLLGHWLDISICLREGRPFHPWLQEDANGVVHGNDWAQGFIEGMQLMYEDWSLLFDDAQQGQLLEPIMALAFEHHADEEMRPYLEGADENQHAAWIAAISPTVEAVYRFFSDLRVDLETDDE
jgi:uncharacterized protein